VTPAKSPNSPPVIVAEQLGVIYGDQVALRNVSFEAYAGERIMVQGHNGAGKSTLIRVLAGLQRPDRGSIAIGGGSPYDRHIRQHIGVVVHNTWLDPDLTVQETLRFFGALYGLLDNTPRLAEVLKSVGMSDRRHQRVGELSRGYQQRLTLARALLHQPAILLLDEPDTGLDEATLATLRDVLTTDGEDPTSRTVVMTSHNRAFGAAITNRTLTLEEGALVESAVAS
jgi:heme exporter protein A